ncbi:MAG: Crp/Fnr family transcriptional regulator [Candidatus Aminicenantes bacterium]
MSKADGTPLKNNIPFSEKLPERLKKAGTRRTYQKEEFLFHPGSAPKGVYFVHTGEIRVFDMDAEGKELEVTRLKSGEFFGEALVFASDSVPFYAEAVKTSQVLIFSSHSIKTLIDRDPEISLFFLKLLAQKCLLLNQRVRSLGLKTVRQRLIHHLLTRCAGNKSCRIDLSMNKGDLARLLGTVNETLSRNLRQLQEEGLIRVEGKLIFVNNCIRLRQELPQ